MRLQSLQRPQASQQRQGRQQQGKPWAVGQAAVVAAGGHAGIRLGVDLRDGWANWSTQMVPGGFPGAQAV